MAARNKGSHFGTAGEYFAMSELLLRGWNVAVPVVDVGDDVLVIDDNDKTTFRIQVKSAHLMKVDDPRNNRKAPFARFTLSREQLRVQLPIELFYMLNAHDSPRRVVAVARHSTPTPVRCSRRVRRDPLDASR